VTTPYYADETLTLLLGNAREVLSTMDAGSVNCVVTSPPYYGLRDYEGNDQQIGLEESPAEYVAALVEVFAEVHRVLAEDGTLWLNLGDSYSSKPGPDDDQNIHARLDGTRDRKRLAMGGERRPRMTGLPEKNLLGIPWRVAFALQDAGWYLRNAIVWHKNAMPESVRDRLSTRYELLFLFVKRKRYWFSLDAIRGDQAGNPGDVWPINTRPCPEAHFATFPVDLPRRCIAAGCRPGGTVLDPFSGAGTTALAAQQLGRRAIGIDINATYHDIALKRMVNAPLPFDHTGGVA
jgi:site-specific DNA-methyltransferase (cytosine-N4-specific)